MERSVRARSRGRLQVIRTTLRRPGLHQHPRPLRPTRRVLPVREHAIWPVRLRAFNRYFSASFTLYLYLSYGDLV